jgi:hypothetical protein
MALADMEPSKRAGRLRCSVGLMLSEMPDYDRETAESWLATPAYSANALLERFKKEGYKCAFTAIGHHRRERCSCYGSA